MDNSSLIIDIERGDYYNAKKKMKQIKFLEFKNLLFDYTHINENNNILKFLKYLLKKEKSKKKLVKLYLLASGIVESPPYLYKLKNAYKLSLIYLRKALRLDPSNIVVKSCILFLYGSPGVNLKEKEIEIIAKEVLEQESKNKIAKKALDYLEGKAKNK
ncbi:MAG: hypothetical protein AABW50_01450 [Nanoarchaeota archaeon]